MVFLKNKFNSVEQIKIFSIHISGGKIIGETNVLLHKCGHGMN